MRADNVPSIKKAHEAMKAACENYSETVLAEFPVGCEVLMEWGEKRLGPYVVEGVSRAWWSDPGRLQLRNPRTGKVRSACPSQVYTIEDASHE